MFVVLVCSLLVWPAIHAQGLPSHYAVVQVAWGTTIEGGFKIIESPSGLPVHALRYVERDNWYMLDTGDWVIRRRVSATNSLSAGDFKYVYHNRGQSGDFYGLSYCDEETVVSFMIIYTEGRIYHVLLTMSLGATWNTLVQLCDEMQFWEMVGERMSRDQVLDYLDGMYDVLSSKM